MLDFFLPLNLPEGECKLLCVYTQTHINTPLGQEDPLEKGMATHPSILAWRILWTGAFGWLHSPWDRKESDMIEGHTFTDT